jgi:diguanylate cyclase (GGDEF)-like protein
MRLARQGGFRMDILVVEDNLQDADLLKLTLRRGTEAANITHKDSVASACSALRHSVYDVILLDLNLPDSDGLATLRQMQQANDAIPIVVMTGYDDEDLAREAVHLGAEDYLVKGSGTATSIIRSLNYAIERNHTAKELRYLAHHDSLTGTANREDFVLELERVLARTKRHAGIAAVVTVNLDRFRSINETLGHAGGDKLLRELAQRLKTGLRRSDTLARLNGDELAIVLDGLENERDAEVVTERLHAVVHEPLTIDAHKISATVSIGVALFPADGRTTMELLANSKTAVQRAKDTGRNRTRFFHEEAEERLHKRRLARDELQTALASQQFTIRYQPRFELGTQNIHSIAATVCWNHPTKGLLELRRFVAAADEEGLVGSIEEQALNALLDQVGSWLLEHPQLPVVSFKLSTNHFHADDLSARLEEMLQLRRLKGKHLEITVSEAALAHNPGRAIEHITQLDELGVRVGIADFGSGFSPISYLTYLPINSIHMTSGMVSSLGDERHAAIARAIVNLARDLGITATADGLVQESQLAQLNDLHCEVVQGDFLIGVLDAESMTTLLADQPSAMPSSTDDRVIALPH